MKTFIIAVFTLVTFLGSPALAKQPDPAPPFTIDECLDMAREAESELYGRKSRLEDVRKKRFGANYADAALRAAKVNLDTAKALAQIYTAFCKP
tara:strand:+ start:183 stop:464 length:282 start_codon:yes stop_codon:yes gene_type:complete